MEEIQGEVLRFRAEKRVDKMMILGLNVLQELRNSQENQVQKLGESLMEIEEFLFNKYGVEIDLGHLVKHVEILDEHQAKAYRKRFLDYGGELRREI